MSVCGEAEGQSSLHVSHAAPELTELWTNYIMCIVQGEWEIVAFKTQKVESVLGLSRFSLPRQRLLSGGQLPKEIPHFVTVNFVFETELQHSINSGV